MIGEFYSGYFNFAVPLWLLTGWFILRLDVKKYEDAGMRKEMKVSRILGWLNLVVGALLLIGAWVIRIFV
ncbi:CLC_0170 family protein [Paenibacillus cisolokensis]|jgi:hypothetical protein|uniref:CLC_0170 family protein n=1 Tax=Paenibacillus TaxID=44249 RepID=UPI00071F34D1|nr:CLC_0170 family protein [Paenibacillus sp. 32O-W]ALS26616.1 hypothetical protein IJ21_12120 [Paenibacillus sp. 32O-W]